MTRTLDGAEVKFGKLTPRDRQGVLNRLKSERRDKLRANLKEAQLEKEQVFAALEDLEDRKYTGADFIAHVNTPEGYEEIAELSWRKLNGGEFAPVCAALESFEENGLLKLACDACGFRFGPAEPASEPDSKNDAAGAAGQGQPTGYGM